MRTSSYDSTNELTTVTDALGHNTVYGFAASGNQITVTDALGHAATTLYDPLNRATTLISATGGVTTITFDAAGRETSLTDPVGNQTQWAYNANDRVTTVTEPNGHTVTYVYDADGELVDTTDADGRRTTYSYNADGDKTGETWVGASPSEQITYTYDSDNEMTGASDSFATLTFTYDADRNVQTAGTSGPGAGQPNVLLSYTHDAAGDETSLTDNLSSAGVTAYSYDLDEHVTDVVTSYGGSAGPQVAYNYDAGSRLTTASRTIGSALNATNVQTSYMYDVANRQTTITHQTITYPSGGSGGGTITPLATYVYSYDNANRVTTQVNADGTYTYTYDNANELTGVDKNGTQVEAYSYDLNGNRTGTGYSTTVMNETATSPGITYTFDNAGNMIAANNGTAITTYTYDYHNRLTGVTQGGTVIATYVYDALNRRIGADDSGTQTWIVYDGTNPYADFNGSGTLEVRYQYGPGVVDGAVVDQLLSRTSAGGTTAWYLPDKLGSVRDAVSTSGTELDHIAYDSFGNIVTETVAANGDRFKFAGMQYDSAISQYYDDARWYSAGKGTFISLDPTGFSAGDPNLYRYVGDGPTDGTDPTGTDGSSSSSGDLLDHAANFFAGWGDSLSGGLTNRIRNNISIGGVSLNAGIDPNSGNYGAGNLVGSLHSIALAPVTPCSVGSVSTGLKLLRAGQQIGGVLNTAESLSNGDIEGALSGASQAAQGSKSMMTKCFAAGTPLLTPDGSKPIEQFQVGDLVLSRDENDPEGAVVAKTVLDLLHNYSPLLELHVGGRVIRTTDEHPFWTSGRGWIAARELKLGDQLWTDDRRCVDVQKVIGPLPSAPVYNLCVEQYHSYFVGQQIWGFAVWSHNGNGCGAASNAVSQSKKTYQTYTKTNLKTGSVYSGRTSGFGSPAQNVAARDRGHSVLNRQGYGPAQLQQSSTSKAPIRGHEQLLIEANGGAQSQNGTSGNPINGVSPRNNSGGYYRQQAITEFRL